MNGVKTFPSIKRRSRERSSYGRDGEKRIIGWCPLGSVDLHEDDGSIEAWKGILGRITGRSTNYILGSSCMNAFTMASQR